MVLFESQFIDVNGLRLRYLVAGDVVAPPVVLLHGGGIDSAIISWRLLIPELECDFRVYALDLPGYGESQPPEVPYTTELLIDTLTTFINLLNLQNLTLVGLSMGGMTALGYSVKNQSRVCRLILVDSYGLQRTAPFPPLSYYALHLPKWLQHAAWATVRNSRLVLRLGLSFIYRNPLRIDKQLLDDSQESIRLEIFYEWLQSEIQRDHCVSCFLDELPDFDVPLLLIHGKNDPSVSPKWTHEAAKLAPKAQICIIPNCGHWAMRERPEQLNQAIHAFLH